MNSVDDMGPNTYECRNLAIPETFYFIVIICLFICGVLSVANFAQWKGHRATVTLLFALSVLQVGREVFGLIQRIISVVGSHYIPHQILGSIVMALDTAWIWAIILLAVFHFKALQLGRQATELPGSPWSVVRARIGIGVISGLVLLVYVPAFILLELSNAYWTGLPLLVTISFVRWTAPGFVLVGMGVALLVARHRASTQIDSEWGNSVNESTRLTGEQAMSRETDNQLTTVVVVIALVLGSNKSLLGVLSIINMAMKWMCAIQWTIRIVGLIGLVLHGVPFVMYVSVLSEFRAVFRRWCRRN